MILGCQPILVDRQGRKTRAELSFLRAPLEFADPAAVVDWLLRGRPL